MVITKHNVVITPIEPTRIRKYLAHVILKMTQMHHIPIILLSNTRIQPLAVMIEPHHTFITKSAMFTRVMATKRHQQNRVYNYSDLHICFAQITIYCWIMSWVVARNTFDKCVVGRVYLACNSSGPSSND
jgi:hypothetical protein